MDHAVSANQSTHTRTGKHSVVSHTRHVSRLSHPFSEFGQLVLLLPRDSFFFFFIEKKNMIQISIGNFQIDLLSFCQCLGVKPTHVPLQSF